MRMKRGAQVDRDDRVPPVLGKIVDLGDVLDAGIVDQDVDAAEALAVCATSRAISAGLDMSAGE